MNLVLTLAYILVFALVFSPTKANADQIVSKKLIASKNRPRAKQNNSVKAWELIQSSNLIGPLKMVVSDVGVRLNSEKMGLLWIFAAPSWDAYLYNLETHNYCSFKYAVWKKRGFFMTGSPKQKANNQNSLKKLKVKITGKTQKIANMKTEQVYFLMDNGTKYGEFWVTSKIKVPNQFKELISNMLRLPPHSGGTPLKASLLKRGGGGLAPVLETQGVTRKEVKASLFKPLKGYKKVKDEMALIFSDSDMFGTGSLDKKIDADTKSKRKKSIF